MLVSINGETVDPSQATVSVFDRGFLFGDAIFEACRTYRRRPFHWDLHLDRLERSGAAIGLDVAPMRARIDAEARRLIADSPAGPGELLLRVMVTRGQSPDLDLLESMGPPQLVVWCKPMAPWRPESYTQGIRLLSVRADDVVGRLSPGVKSNNRAANVMVHRIARAKGYDDGLFVDPAGCVTEGPTWNLFMVKGGVLVTAPLERGILEGVTRRTVLRLCKEHGVRFDEREVPLADAHAADEMFITSTTRGVMPVRQLDERTFKVPGPITRRLADALAVDMEKSTA